MCDECASVVCGLCRPMLHHRTLQCCLQRWRLHRFSLCGTQLWGRQDCHVFAAPAVSDLQGRGASACCLVDCDPACQDFIGCQRFSQRAWKCVLRRLPCGHCAKLTVCDSPSELRGSLKRFQHQCCYDHGPQCRHRLSSLLRGDVS